MNVFYISVQDIMPDNKVNVQTIIRAVSYIFDAKYGKGIEI